MRNIRDILGFSSCLFVTQMMRWIMSFFAVFFHVGRWAALSSTNNCIRVFLNSLSVVSVHLTCCYACPSLARLFSSIESLGDWTREYGWVSSWRLSTYKPSWRTQQSLKTARPATIFGYFLMSKNVTRGNSVHKLLTCLWPTVPGWLTLQHVLVLASVVFVRIGS
jgi:hypothetical protein